MRHEINGNIINLALQKIARGTGIIFIGTIVGIILAFLSRVIIVRGIAQTPSEYGIYSLTLSLISIFIVISSLGLQLGSTRYIAFLRGLNKKRKIKEIIFSSLKISLFISVIFSLIIILFADFISTNIFHDLNFSTPLKIFSITIPFVVLMNIFTSFFRGFNNVGPDVYFQKIMRNGIFFFFLITIILLGLSFFELLFAYLLSIVISCLAYVIYTIKKLPLSISPITTEGRDDYNNNPIGKEVLFFSLPLMISSLLGVFMYQLDTLMLGYFKTSEIVGLYNGAVPLTSNILTLPLYSAGFIFIPIFSYLFSQKKIGEMKRIYSVLTKWIFSVSVPIFLIFFLFSETVLDFLFGHDYVQAGAALQILSLGFIIHALFGSNGNTLVVMGKTKFIMITNVICVSLNLCLNSLLIPSVGMLGAAIATTLSLGMTNILFSIKLYQDSGIHPFNKNYIKSIIISIVLIFLIFGISKMIFSINYLHLILFVFIFLLLYGLCLYLTKSLDKEDIQMFLQILKKFGIGKTIKNK